jgi:hypothetical protein
MRLRAGFRFGVGLKNRLDSLLRKMTQLRQKVMRTWAEKFIDECHKLVETGSPDWAPLSARYLDWKVRVGYSPKIWIRTGKTISSLKTFRIGNRLIVGFPMPYSERALYMEKGTSRMPARPLLQKVADKFRREGILVSSVKRFLMR